MKKPSLIIGLVFLVLAIVIFIFADGLRRYHSGGFFLLMAVVLFLQSSRALIGTSDSMPSDQEQSGEDGSTDS
jgi:hypothetical protein